MPQDRSGHQVQRWRCTGVHQLPCHNDMYAVKKRATRVDTACAWRVIVDHAGSREDHCVEDASGGVK